MENKPQTTRAQSMMQHIENMEMCSCEREQVQFSCEESPCPNHETQKYYCIQCSESDSHNHKITTIVKLCSAIDHKWIQLKQDFTHLNIKVRSQLCPNERLF